MNVDNCYQLGDILKTHGLKGEVITHFDVDSPSDYRNLESVFILQSGKMIPFFVSTIRLQGDKARIAFEDITNIDHAQELVGAELYLPINQLPELGKSAYYFHEVIGYSIHQDKVELGEITEIYDQEHNPLFAFVHQGKEVLVPFQDHFILKVDKSAKEIHINLPDGYLEIYMET
ncbi:MAG: 16S rRNA processing protein RimM [Cytophagales bacterium]|nr:16S rRNA processing protein RimM [Cytophagales bacterium]